MKTIISLSVAAPTLKQLEKQKSDLQEQLRIVEGQLYEAVKNHKSAYMGICIQAIKDAGFKTSKREGDVCITTKVAIGKSFGGIRLLDNYQRNGPTLVVFKAYKIGSEKRLLVAKALKMPKTPTAENVKAKITSLMPTVQKLVKLEVQPAPLPSIRKVR